MKVLGLVTRSGRAHLYQLRPEQVSLGEVTPDELLRTIREATLRALW
jgi:hypothetical protein